ncbi:hypothetical protein ZTR_07898 [Talaromyces verruculosus]|nr:hypothetical protein ZTR_07898 [Talaromyces verruculosus]
MAEDNRSPVATTADSPSMSALNTEQPSAESSRTERKDENDGVENDKQSSPEAEDEEQGEDGLEQKEEKQEEENKAVAAAEDAPPLPDEEVPPLPDEAPPGQDTEGDDGWEPVWDANAQAFYFYNRLTGVSQWENPRVPDAAAAAVAVVPAPISQPEVEPVARGGGYNPAIHGDYDPTAAYAQQYEPDMQQSHTVTADQLQSYAATGAFNRFTGRWQDASLTPENFNDENKSRRQMNAYFDVDAAANSHDGRSLKAERSGKKLSKAEVKAFREKRRERKEEKRRAWLRD